MSELWNKDEIFDEDDNNIELVSIRGIDSSIDIDAEETERSKGGSSNPSISQANNQGIKPKKQLVKKADSTQ